jgi:hypothetical protein
MTDSTAHAETQAAPSPDTRESPRLFWVGMAVFLTVMVFLGFGSTSLFAQDDPAPLRNWSKKQANV